MLAIELLALVALLGAGSIGARLVWSAAQRASDRAEERRRRQRDMDDDLRTALRSRDYRSLDDFIAMWGADASPKTLDYVKSRRDELYVDGPGDTL